MLLNLWTQWLKLWLWSRYWSRIWGSCSMPRQISMSAYYLPTWTPHTPKWMISFCISSTCWYESRFGDTSVIFSTPWLRFNGDPRILLPTSFCMRVELIQIPCVFGKLKPLLNAIRSYMCVFLAGRPDIRSEFPECSQNSLNGEKNVYLLLESACLRYGALIRSTQNRF